MHRSGFFLIALGASLVMLSSSFSEDSSDLFLNAYKTSKVLKSSNEKPSRKMR